MPAASDWLLTMASGGVPVVLPHAAPVVYSQDGRHAIVMMSHQLRVYFISTRQCIRTIDVPCLDAVDFRLDPALPDHILIQKGETLLKVDWKEKSVQEQKSIAFRAVVGISETYVVGVAGHQLVRYDRKQNTQSTLVDVEHKLFAVSEDLQTIAFVSGHLVHLYNIGLVFDGTDADALAAQVASTKEIVPFVYKTPILSIAVANDLTVALGTSSGTIQVVYGGLAVPKPQRLLKWHIDAVRSLCFSPDNVFLLSGGMEKVLVFWHLESDKNHFLPRLNGTVDRISIDRHKPDYYSMVLRSSAPELLIISAVDLISRLAVSPVKPSIALPSLEAIARTITNTKDMSRVHHNITAPFEVHPMSKHLYFPNNSSIQAYDPVKNEQAFVQNVAPALSTGKVRSETQIVDPEVTHVAFSNSGEWMCTFDVLEKSSVDNLLSKNDLQYALKFWKYTPDTTNAKAGAWELTTKIIDPHGPSRVLAIVPGPVSYHGGLAFLTADSLGGLRVWRPRIPSEVYSNSKAKPQQTAWTMRKSRSGGALKSDSVDVAWSRDGSIIIVGHEYSISTISADTFDEIPHDYFKIPSLSGSKIRSLSLIDNDLIVLSKTRISSFNLLKGEQNELVARVNTTHGAKNLIAVDPVSKFIMLAVNYYTEKPHGIRAKIIIFKPNQLTPVHSFKHPVGIVGVRFSGTSFVFVDTDLRVGYVASTALAETPVADVTRDMNDMLIKAQATADIISTRNAPVATKHHHNVLDDHLEVARALDVNSFAPVFLNVEGVQISDLFEKVMKIVK